MHHSKDKIPLEVASPRSVSGYQHPTEGLLSRLPSSWVPYGELMRLHKPAGYYAFYFPHLVGYVFAKNIGVSSQTSSIREECLVHLRLLIGCLLLRGAACTWNDWLDADYDRQVTRCRSRPIARNAVGTRGALLFTALQALLGVTFCLVPLPHACWIPAALLTASQSIYPLLKRFTDLPAVWLGFSISFGITVGAGAAGLDVTAISTNYLYSILDKQIRLMPSDVSVLAATACLYLAGVVNILIYDTIYGHQDLVDDKKAGVKSLAVTWLDKTKRNLAVASALEVLLLVAIGVVANLTPQYYVVAVGGTAGVLVTVLRRVKLEIPSSCMWGFKSIIWGTGLACTFGLLSIQGMVEARG